jgi:hypothetical protein
MPSTKYLINFDVRHIYQYENRSITMSCWYASAQMVLAFRSVGVMLVNTSSNIDTLERLFRCQGISPTDIKRFASEVGLNAMAATNVIESQTIYGWGKALKKFGPLWVPIIKTRGNNSYGHIIVIRGAMLDDQLIIDDPEDLVATATTSNELNNSVYWNLPFLYKLGVGVAL